MQGDIKNVATTFKPGCQSPQLSMVFEEEDRMFCPGEPVGTGQATQTGAYNYYVVTVFYFIKGGEGHADIHSLLVNNEAPGEFF